MQAGGCRTMLPQHQAEAARSEHAAVEPVGEQVDKDGREPSAKDVDQVVGLDVDGGSAEKHVEGGQKIAELLVDTPGHDHQDGGDAYMRAGKSGGRALAYFLRGFYKLVEEAVVEIGTGQQDVVVVEVVADGGKMAGHDLVHADGGEVELRACHGHKDVDEVVDEKRGDQHKGDFLEPLEPEYEVVEHHDGNHGVIGKVAQIEGLAEPDGGVQPTELYRGLAAEEPLLGRGKQVVEVGKEAVELERVGIPVGQKGHLHGHAHKGGQAAGMGLVQVDQGKGYQYDAHTLQKHHFRALHLAIEADNQQ